MEEILASIRRIIAEEDTRPPASSPASGRPAPDPDATVSGPAAGDEVLELTDMVRDDGGVVSIARPGEPAGGRVDAGDRVGYDGDPSAAADTLVAPDVAERAAEAIARLSADSPAAAQGLAAEGRTIEDVVRELLRPMLKAWLDERLPVLVEAIVRDEIRRVARRTKS